MLGVARGIRMSTLHRLIPFGIAGFVLSLSSGFMFVVTFPDQYLHNPAFVLKFGFMALAGINMALFYATTARAVLGYHAGCSATAAGPHLRRGVAAVLAGGDRLRASDHGVPAAMELVLLVLSV